MIIHNCEQLSEEWFAIRLGKVTGSHFSEVMNKKGGRKTYMYKLIAEKLSGDVVPSYSNKAMEFGSEYEERAKAYYARLFGSVEEVGFIELNENVGCSPDGLVGNDGIIEIKYPFPQTHIKYIHKNTLPTEYRAQVQGNLWVTGRKWCDFISYNAKIKDRPFWKIRVARDEDYIKELKIQTIMFINEMKELEDKITNKNMNF